MILCRQQLHLTAGYHHQAGALPAMKERCHWGDACQLAYSNSSCGPTACAPTHLQVKVLPETISNGHKFKVGAASYQQGAS